MTCFLGLDAGGTVLKAELYAADGERIAGGFAHCPASTPRPGWVERDMDELWRTCAAAIRRCLDAAPVSPGDIAGVGIVGHNDGLYAVDGAGRPVRPAILSADARAAGLARAWQGSEVAAEVLAITGQLPYAGSPASLCAWMRDNEPDALRSARTLLFCKDWLRHRLTGHLGTDPTEASASFVDVRSGAYSRAALELLGLAEVEPLLPAIEPSCAVVGEVRRGAAEETGLRAGTPVVCGAHDVDGAAVGMGSIEVGRLSLIAGTFSINQVVTDAVRPDARWQARLFLEPGRWMTMSTSPASASNLDWVVRRFGPGGPDPFAAAGREVEAVLDDRSTVVFLPYVYGAPAGVLADGTFAGLQAWHTRAHMLRAVFEGIVLNHRHHVDALRSRFALLPVARLTGGGARSELWSQMFSDALRMPVEIVDTEETGARGAAMLAAVGLRTWPDVATAATRSARVVRRHEPDPGRADALDELYERFLAIRGALSELAEPAGG